MLAKQFSVTGHPGHYRVGEFVLLLMCQFWLLELTFSPMSMVPPDLRITVWVTNVTSGVLAGFVVVNVAVGFGVVRGIALQWLPFLFQTLGALAAATFAAGWFRVWARPTFMSTGLVNTAFPARAWALYPVYLVGLGLFMFGLLGLSGLAEVLTIGFGVLATVGGYVGATSACPVAWVEKPRRHSQEGVPDWAIDRLLQGARQADRLSRPRTACLEPVAAVLLPQEHVLGACWLPLTRRVSCSFTVTTDDVYFGGMENDKPWKDLNEGAPAHFRINEQVLKIPLAVVDGCTISNGMFTLHLRGEPPITCNVRQGPSPLVNICIQRFLKAARNGVRD
ncbi:MAG TPA: hypothetical protein VNV42_08370 [Solirubrobacteraceae bacterium]|nr:hypothetical protein [Solirubrobacteraceae bacterium]